MLIRRCDGIEVAGISCTGFCTAKSDGMQQDVLDSYGHSINKKALKNRALSTYWMVLDVKLVEAAGIEPASKITPAVALITLVSSIFPQAHPSQQNESTGQ